jgi:hypothetical protein
MKELVKILSILLLIINCQGTNDKDKNHIVTFNLKELPNTSEIKLSDLGFVDIEYIPMETNEQSFITGSNDLITGNKIIIGDSFFLIQHYTTILMFNNNGSFVTRIGSVGRGPNEFTVAHDVDINSKDHKIYLVSAWQKKFNVYSESGEFIKTFNIPLYAPIDFRFIDGNILCYCENHMGNIENSYTLLDTNGQVIKSFPNKYPFKNHDAFGFTHENLFYRFDNRLFKKEVYSDTVYVYEKMDFKPHLVIEVGKKLITPDARSKYEGLDIAKNYINPLNLFEFGDYVYYEFIYKFVLPDDVLIFSFIGSKKNNFRAIFNTGQGIINDLDGGPNIVPKTTKDDNTIIAWIDPLKLKAHVASEAFKNSTPKFPQKKKDLEKLANSLKETDNPVLVLVKLKK